MKVKTLTEDLNLPIGEEIDLSPDTASQYIGWGLVEAIEQAISDPPADLGGLTEEELEELTNP